MARDCLGQTLEEGDIVLFPGGDYMMVGSISLSNFSCNRSKTRVTYPGPGGTKFTSKYKNSSGLVKITKEQLDQFADENSNDKPRVLALIEFIKTRLICLNQQP